jgi:hypothetical protein
MDVLAFEVLDQLHAAFTGDDLEAPITRPDDGRLDDGILFDARGEVVERVIVERLTWLRGRGMKLVDRDVLDRRCCRIDGREPGSGGDATRAI